MNKSLRIALSFTTFFVAIKILGVMFDLRPSCEDGWMSPSIGRQGACSSHGGVDRSAYSRAFLFSVAVSVTSYNFDRFFGFVSSLLRQTPKEMESQVDQRGYERQQSANCDPENKSGGSKADPRSEEIIREENAYYQKRTEEYLQSELEKIRYRSSISDPPKRPPSRRKTTKRKPPPWR